MFQHTAARRRLVGRLLWLLPSPMFQHTAARRRLATQIGCHFEEVSVSTHSRPKAAGNRRNRRNRHKQFQHTAARRRLHE